LLERAMAAGLHSGRDASLSPSSFALPTPDELAGHFPQLEIVALLGRGGMGAVYKARQKGLDRLVALKILPSEVARDPAFAERFAREARVLARLRHPGIVMVHDLGQSGSLYYFLMEYVDGSNLRQVLEAGQLEPAQALAIVPQICAALQYAHDAGVVHRDIKPENILLDPEGRVKIADFGLAKLLGQERPDVTLTNTHQVMGTLRYMAPEQLDGSRSVDHRADIYALGVVFYELLTGEVPAGRFDPPSQKVEIDVRLDDVVFRALAREPDRRYQHASEVKTDVEAIASRDEPLRQPPASTPSAAAPLANADYERGAARLRPVAIALFLVGLASVLTGFALAAWCGIGLAAVASAPAAPRKTVSPASMGGLGGSQSITVTPKVGHATKILYVLGLVTQIATVAIGGILIAAAAGMSRLEYPGLARLAAGLAMAPVSPVWLAGMPVGLRATLTLNRRDVRRAYSAAAQLEGEHLRGVDLPGLFTAWTASTTVGSVLAVAAMLTALLPWSDLSVSGTHMASHGFDYWQGLAAGAAAVIAALMLALTGLLPRWRNARGAVAAVAGLLIVVLSAHALWQLRSPISFGDATATGDLGANDELTRGLTAMLKDLVQQLVVIRPAFGVYACLVAGSALIIFGLVDLLRQRLDRKRPLAGSVSV
jgi:tRNA A-37 threonylcarbamoyl transferase component Bud32